MTWLIGGGVISQSVGFLSEIFAPELTFTTNSLGENRTVMLDASTAAVIYTDRTSSDTKCVVISDLNDVTPSVGTPFQLESFVARGVSIDAMDSTTIVATYHNVSNTVVMRTVSDVTTSPSVSGSTTMSTTSASPSHRTVVKKITTDEAIVFYSNNKDLKARKVTGVTGTPSVGSALAVSNSEEIIGADFELMNATQGIVCFCYNDGATTGAQKYKVVSNIDTTPTFGAETTIDTVFSGTGNNVNTAKLDNDDIVFLLWRSTSLLSYYLITDITTSPIVGSQQTISGVSGAVNTASMDISQLGSQTALVSYGINDFPSEGISIVYLKDLLSSPSNDAPVSIRTTPGVPTFGSNVGISSFRGLVIYGDVGGTEDGLAIRVQ